MNESRDDRDSEARGLIDRLPREIAPPKDLWPAIEAAIGREATEADRLLQGLPQEVAPPDEVWSNVAAGISARKTGIAAGRWSGLRHAPRLAASIAVLAVLGTLLFRSGVLDDGVEPAAELAAAGSADDWLTPSLWSSGLDPSTQMSASFEEVRRTYLEQIAAVRRERTEIESLLAVYPDQLVLRELWMHVYETELLLIDEAGRVLTTVRTGWHS